MSGPVDAGSYESLYRTLSIAQSAILLITLFVTIFARAILKKVSWDSTGSKIEDVKKELAEKDTAMNLRLDRAGKKTSDLASSLQGMPERLRAQYIQQFASRETLTLFMEEMRVDRGVLRQDIADLRDRVDNLIRSNKV